MQTNSPNKRGLYRRLLQYLRIYRGQFILALGCLIVFGATDGVVPFLVKYVLDDIFSHKDTTLLQVIPVVLLIFAVVRGAADFGQQFLMARVGHYVVRDIRNDINKHLLKQSPDYFLFNSSAGLVSRVTSDVVLVRSLLTDSLSAVIRDTIRVVVLIISALVLDPYLAAIALIAFPIGIYPIYRFGRRMRKLSKRGQEEIGALSARLQESVLGHRVVKVFGQERYEESRFNEENSKLTNTFVKAEVVRALTGPINEILAAMAVAGVILYGGYSVIGGTRTQGDFIAFLISVFLLYDPFKKLSRVNSTIQQALGASERIFDVLDSQPSIQDCVSPIGLGLKNSIEIDQVSFAYPTAQESPVLREISLEIQEGEKVAVVGFSGAGKSTLVDLLVRFIDPQIGSVRIGSVDIKQVKLSELRSRIAMVSQHTFLFNDTIANNIRYGRRNATDEEVASAARAAFADHFIRELPKGYETLVGEGGFSLSGGERQRIAIARAILKDAPILILDEATASLDNRSEREVQAALDALSKDRTTIMIAHRLSTVRDANRIVVMRDGKIVEIGTHDELLRLGGEYEKLHLLQFKNAEEQSPESEELLS